MNNNKNKEYAQIKFEEREKIALLLAVKKTQKEIANELNIKTYFCTPYHSWEKGTVENRIGGNQS